MSPPSHQQVTAALDTVIELGPSRVGAPMLAEARDLRAKLDERLARGEWFTVAAIAGGTGVGKSALLNALVGGDIATEGVRRPTTSVTLAAVRRHDASSTALLDWLEVPDRHEVGDRCPDGLILLDLPDHDSVAESHRVTAARLAQRVDVVVWVLDPIKYARADAHQGPLAALTAHADVLLVALNRVDELTTDDAAACLDDLRSRLVAEGHEDARVIATSATTGIGVDELRTVLHDIARRRDAAARRLVADAQVMAERLAAEVEPTPHVAATAAPLLPSMLEATDGHRAVGEAAQHYRADARRACRSPLGRAARSPVTLVRATAAGMGLLRGPEPQPATTATAGRVETALLRELQVGRTVGRTYGGMNREISAAATNAAPALLDAVATAGLQPRRRWWWPAVATVKTVSELSSLIGLLWLVAVSAADWLRLPELPLPHVAGDLPWPTALVLGGLLVRVVVGAGSRLAITAGARRHARGVEREIRRRLRAVIDERLLAPVRAHIADHARLVQAIDVLRSGERGRVG